MCAVRLVRLLRPASREEESPPTVGERSPDVPVSSLLREAKLGIWWSVEECGALKTEEEAFNRTLDKGILLFEKIVAHSGAKISGEDAFLLYDTYGFPLDLTELMARESGLAVDKAGFERLMQEQRERAQAAQKKTVIELSEVETKEATRFIGYDELSNTAKVLEVVALKDKTAVILDASTAYAEMGGQVGDSGEISAGANSWRIANTTKVGHTWLHFLEGTEGTKRT